MSKVTIFHSNDLHGNIANLARIAAYIHQQKELRPDRSVLYIDAGDSEEIAVPLSNYTRGVAMYVLLQHASCDVVTLGNGGLLTYGPDILPAYARFVSPIVLGNIRDKYGKLLPAVQASVLFTLEKMRVGIIGCTSPQGGDYSRFWGLSTLPLLTFVRTEIASLRAKGANVILLLSHLGFEEDRWLAEQLQDEINLIIGGHSHHHFSKGLFIGNVCLAQAGAFGNYLGSINLVWEDGKVAVEHIKTIPVQSTMPVHRPFMEAYQALEHELARYLDEIISIISEPLPYSDEKESCVTNIVADILRTAFRTDIAVICAGAGIRGPLPAGPLKRKQLWDLCPLTHNPGYIRLIGWQLQELIQRGMDTQRAARFPRPLRGARQGLMHLSGAIWRSGQVWIGNQNLEKERWYTVAGTGWEFEANPYDGWFLDPAWNCVPSYHMNLFLREILEDSLRKGQCKQASVGRIYI